MSNNSYWINYLVLFDENNNKRNNVKAKGGRKLSMSSTVLTRKNDNSLIFYEINNNTMVLTVIADQQETQFKIVHFFTIKGEEFTINHTYSSIYDFMFNPKKKFDFLKETKNYNCTHGNYDISCYEDIELKQKFEELNIPIPVDVHEYYAYINNKMLHRIKDRIIDEARFSGEEIVESYNAIELSVRKMVTINNECFYFGDWLNAITGNRFTWISHSYNQLLNTLETASIAYLGDLIHSRRRACFDTMKTKLNQLS